MPQQKIERNGRRRSQVKLKPDSFSDIIFGLALSIGSLILIENRVQVWQSFVWNLILFGFSFAIISLVWLSFSGTMRFLSTEVPAVIFLNLVLFFCVILEPYLFYMQMSSSGQLSSVISQVFAFDVGFMFFVLGIMAEMVVKEARLNHPNYHSDNLKTLQNMIYPRYIAGALYLISVIPFFWIQTPLGHLRSIVWTSALAVFFAYTIKVSLSHSNSKGGQGAVKATDTSESTKICPCIKEQEKSPMKRVFDQVDERLIFVNDQMSR
ncbi:MAG TPA: hypothetical protein VK536_06555 [Candidatus Limnocylindrales bacterium]|nr:hypothetical protein [Candidatus Limnocylindrales bacterium]